MINNGTISGIAPRSRNGSRGVSHFGRSNPAKPAASFNQCTLTDAVGAEVIRAKTRGAAMSDHDMPAKDAARYGGPAGWALYTAAFQFERLIGVAITGWVNGERKRCAVRALMGNDGPDVVITSCIPALSKWVSSKGWERNG